jgi:hypothetical protein
VVDETLFVGDNVGDKVVCDEVVEAWPVAEIRVGAGALS